MATAQNKALAQRFYDQAFNFKNLAICDELFAPDFVLDFPAGPGTLYGVEGIKQAVTTFLTAFPDTVMTIEEVIGEDDKVVVQWTYQGTHQAEWLGIPATGKRVAFNGTDILRIANGKIVEIRVRGGMLGLLRQLGVGPALAQGTGGNPPRLSDLQKRKLTVQFNFNDANRDGFVEQADFERIAQVWADQRGYAPGTPGYERLHDMATRQWAMLVQGAGGERDRLSRDEFVAAMAHAATMAPNFISELAAVVFEAFDADEDGRIALHEYQQRIALAAPHLTTQTESFRRLDSDDDGYISRQEFSQLMTEFMGDDPDAAGNSLFGAY